MTPRDYCFWLRGAIELSDPADLSPLTSEKSMKEIRGHLTLVLADTTKAFREEYPDDCFGLEFCRWLDTWIDSSAACLTFSQLGEIDQRLSQVFITEIDPSFSNSEFLQRIHDGDLVP